MTAEPSLPAFIEPMLATRGQPFDSQHYLFEIKWDGIRMLAFIDRGGYRLMNRHGVNTTERYPEFAFLAGLAPGTILDGEMVVLPQRQDPISPWCRAATRRARRSRFAHSAERNPLLTSSSICSMRTWCPCWICLGGNGGNAWRIFSSKKEILTWFSPRPSWAKGGRCSPRRAGKDSKGSWPSTSTVVTSPAGAAATGSRSSLRPRETAPRTGSLR